MEFLVKHAVRITLGFLSIFIGTYFLYRSSFSEQQFADDDTTKDATFCFVAVLFIVLLLIGPGLKNFLVGEPRMSHFVAKSVVRSFCFVIVSVLIFLIKFPRFQIRSEYERPCVDEQREKISRGIEFNFFSLAAFSFLSSIVSFKRKQLSEPGSFGYLLGLTIDTSMEIKGIRGTNLWYIVSALLWCIILIILRCYAEALRENSIGEIPYERVWIGLELLLVCVGLCLLSLSSFAKLQFEGLADLRVAFFCVFGLLIGSLMSKLPEWSDKVVKVCGDSILMTTLLKSSLLVFASLMIFLNKYPRFKVHTIYLQSCPAKERKKMTQGRLFDLLSAGTFSFFSLVAVSTAKRDRPMDFGIFTFLLELTMDAAIEILENQGPNYWYVLGASVYCVVLIFLESYFTCRQGNDEKESSSVANFVEIESDRPSAQDEIADENHGYDKPDDKVVKLPPRRIRLQRRVLKED